MATLLYVKSSIFGDHGQSSVMAEQVIQRWQQANPNGNIVVRDLSVDTPPYLDGERLTAIMTAASDRTNEQQAVVDYADAIIDEVMTADAIVMGVPMYNFAIPAQLKSYFDYLARAGVTFQYTENGPVGLVNNKPVFLLFARGGQYQGTATDSQTPFLTTLFNFIGLTDIHHVYAEGLNMGDEVKQQALADAANRIATLPVA